MPPKEKRAAFFITVNPNISRKDLPIEVRNIIYQRMIEYAKKVHTGIQNASLLKKIYSPHYQNPEPAENSVNRYDYSVEVGEKLGFIHIHIFVKIDQACHLDQAKLRKMASEYIRGDRKRVHLNIKFIRDPTPFIENYMDKQRNSEVSGSL